MAKKCPKCQSDNPGTATFCADCGTQLPSLEDIEVTATIDKIEQAGDGEVNVIKVEEEEIEENVPPTDDAPVITLINSIFKDAIKKGATDVHIEPYERSVRVRYRIDGVLHEMMDLPLKFKNPTVSRVKVLSDLDISERRIPQDGGIAITASDKTLNIQVSTLPVRTGERIVMKITDPSHKLKNIDTLGFLPQDLERFKGALRQPSGIVLVTGPRASGKTTTLYSALNHLKRSEVCILTAEDPIECNIEGINQVMLREEIGYTYASAIKNFVHQDPDIIMLQEFPDRNVAELAMRTSLEGYLLLSSLNVDDASASLMKLLDFGIKPDLVGSAIRFILSQRLVKKICESCKDEFVPDISQQERLMNLIPAVKKDSQIKLFRGTGCDKCRKTGFRGRIPICEILEVSDTIRKAILKDASWQKIRDTAVKAGMETLGENAWKRAFAGETTEEECLRISK